MTVPGLQDSKVRAQAPGPGQGSVYPSVPAAWTEQDRAVTRTVDNKLQAVTVPPTLRTNQLGQREAGVSSPPIHACVCHLERESNPPTGRLQDAY